MNDDDMRGVWYAFVGGSGLLALLGAALLWWLSR